MNNRGIKKAQRETLIKLVLLFFCIQLAHSIFNVNNWPFCSYNMFNHLAPLQVNVIKVKLYESTGGEKIVEPGNILPIEFFRANRLISKVYISSNNKTNKERLSQIIIK